MALHFKPAVLIILDGFGIAPPTEGNAVSSAKKPYWDSLLQKYPVNLLEASGLNVGLPQGEVGNSEVGHVTIGSGILKYQSLPRINKSISTGQFFKLLPLQNVLKKVKAGKGKLHLIGLLGNGGVHSSQEHLEALISLVRKGGISDRTFLHVFLDGRDTTKDTGIIFMDQLLKFTKKGKFAQVASLGGRFWGMDRNKNWDRIAKAYNAIVKGEAAIKHKDPIKAIKESYKKNIFDEEMEPVVFVDKKDQPLATVSDNDFIIFFNYRADRSRQLTQALVLPDFNKFPAEKFKNLQMITFTEYEKGLPVEVLFSVEIINNPLAKIFSDLNLQQLHIAETEKYAHITFFLNGMVEDTLSGEKRVLIPSPAVTSYDQKPEMSAALVTEAALKEIKSKKFDFICLNFANADMVGHTGNLKASIKGVETVDQCLAKIIPEILKNSGSAFIVGDHGNAEEMINPITGEADKEHNIYPVPFLIANDQLYNQPTPGIVDNDLSVLTPVGVLADVAPTLLKVIGLPSIQDMTGKSLL